MKRLLTMAVLSLCLLTSVAFASTNGTMDKEKTNLDRSVSAKDITFTINDYSITNNKLIVNYTVQCKANPKHDMEYRGLIERADVFIAGKRTHPTGQTEKKISEEKYTGSAEIDLPKDLPNQFDVKFNTDVILNQEGQWTVNFKVE